MPNKKFFNQVSILLAVIVLTACSAHIEWEFPHRTIQSLDRETAELAEVAQDALELAEMAGPDNVLVVFDLDNTLLAMEQGLGADQWYEWQKTLDKNDGCSPMNVGDRLAVQGALYFISAMRPTQADAAAQVKAIQDNGIPVVVVTSRGPDFRLQTFRELRRNGFSFTRSAIGPFGGFEQPFVPIEGGRLSRYEDGVFLTAGQHKGRMLQSLLKKTGASKPAVVVVADDKQENLDAVEETFTPLDVPVRAWRYSGEDTNVEAFDPDQANAEWLEIKDALWQIQQVLGPDNYDLSNAKLPEECH